MLKTDSVMGSTLRVLCFTLGAPAVLYFGILGAMVVSPSLQAHAVYLHAMSLTWFNDLNAPEQFGFAHRQVTPFYITTPDGERLHSWHVLPLGAYIEHQPTLLAQEQPSGLVENIEETLNFKLLKDNPNARLVLYFHGASGTLASEWRPDGYRAISAADPANIHILTFDYRGYGESSGYPSEEGIITDALTIADWAMNTANIPPERIVIYGQSLGSAVSISLVHELARREPKIHFAGVVLTAVFSDVARLAATYSIGGMVPVLSPLAKIPFLFDYFVSHLGSEWNNFKKLGEFIQAAQRFDITMIHAEDDPIVPTEHAYRVFGRATSVVEEAKMDIGVDKEKTLSEKLETRKEARGEGGSFTLWPTTKGAIRLEILKYGTHDKLMSFPVTGIAINRAFASVNNKV